MVALVNQQIWLADVAMETKQKNDVVVIASKGSIYIIYKYTLGSHPGNRTGIFAVRVPATGLQ